MTVHFAHFDGTTISLPATGTQAVWKLRQFLTEATGGTTPASGGGAGWTCTQDGDGVSNYSSSGTAITSPNSGAHGLGNTNAWFILTSPDGTHNWLFQRGSTDLLWRIKVTPVPYLNSGGEAGVTFGTPPTTTGGSTGGLGSDDKIILGGGSDSSPSFSNLFDTNGSYRWNISADDAGPYTWVAWSTVSGSGSATACHTILAFDYAMQANSLDTEPWIYMSQYSGINPTHFNTNPGLSFGPLYYWQCHGVVGQVWCTGTGANLNFYGPGTIPFGDGVLPVSPYSDASDTTFPIYVGNTNAGQGGKGISTIFQWESPVRNVGSTLSSSTLYSLGYATVRWDGTVPVT